MNNKSIWRVCYLMALVFIIAVSGSSCGKQEPKQKETSEKPSPTKETQEPKQKEARELKIIENLRSQLEGKDPIVKIKAILETRKLGENKLAMELVPVLIDALSDGTSIQIPENLIGADIKINTQYGHGTELRFMEGDMFPTDSGLVIAGKNARLRVSTPRDEAYSVLKQITGKDFGLDQEKWRNWWNQQPINR